jgi:hypothetical protein
MNIYSLESNMPREMALQKLALAGPRGMVRRWLKGNLHALAEVYLPYRLYRVVIEDRRLQSTRFYAIDAATGVLDPYQFASLPDANSFINIETRNCHPLLLGEKQTNQLAIERVRRSLFSGGFFRLNNPLIAADLVQTDFYIPYWAGFYGEEGNLKIAVLNAVRQTHEGSKLRQLIQGWLLGSQRLHEKL